MKRDVNWEDLKTFLACAEAESFRQAAERLGVRSSTIVRRIDRLESSLKVCVFSRLANGVKLTAEGAQLLESAHHFSDGEEALRRAVSSIENPDRGAVKIAVTEGLGSYWLAPQVVGFQRANPMMIIDLHCANEAADLRNMRADLSIQYDDQSAPESIRRRLGRLHVYTFASKRYLSVYGWPKSRADMANHRLVDQIGAQLDHGVWPKFFELATVEGVVGVRSNSSVATYIAIESGAGIGALPSYALLLGADLEAVDVGFRHSMELWLCYHPEAMKRPRVRKVADWLTACFDPKTYPWFGDDFIHPRDILASGAKAPRLRSPDRGVFGDA